MFTKKIFKLQDHSTHHTNHRHPRYINKYYNTDTAPWSKFKIEIRKLYCFGFESFDCMFMISLLENWFLIRYKYSSNKFRDGIIDRFEMKILGENWYNNQLLFHFSIIRWICRRNIEYNYFHFAREKSDWGTVDSQIKISSLLFKVNNGWNRPERETVLVL